MKRAFSLIEVIIVAGILIILGAFLLPNLFNGSREAQLNSTTQQIVASVRSAQSQAATQAQGSVWGIHFANATNTTPFYAIFSGSSYTTSGTVATYPLPASLAFTTSTLPPGGTEDIIFNPVSGTTATSTTVGLYVISQPALSSTIAISNVGEISAKTPSTPSSPVAGGNSWYAATALPAAIYGHAVVSYNNYIYTLGGADASSQTTSSVSYAQINSNGTLGAWQNALNMPLSENYLSAIAYNGYLYAIGGDVGTPYFTVLYAPLNSDGSVGNSHGWQTTAQLPVGLYCHSSALYNGYVYTTGGMTNSGPTSNVYYSSFNSNGTLNAWQATTAMPTALYCQSAVAYNGYLYVTGGFTGGLPSGVVTSTVSYAQINSNGTLGSWQATTALPTGMYTHSAVASNGFLYTTGGYANGSGVTSTVLDAAINPNGTIGSWQAMTALPAAVQYQAAVTNNGFLYTTGGLTNGVVTSSVFYTSIH